MQEKKKIKVLWITTSPTGVASRILHIANAGSSGGWVLSAYDSLKDREDVEIVFASSSKSIARGKMIKRTESGITAYCTHLGRVSFGVRPHREDIAAWKAIIDEVRPDLIHVWGTETSVQRDALLANGNRIPSVIFIQGLIGIHNHYQDGYFFSKENAPYRSLLGRMKSIIPHLKSRYFRNQIASEQTAIRMSGRIITDNQFTRDYCSSVYRECKFYSCPLPVNAAFLEASWSLEACKRHQIFTLFGLSGSKGMHQLLKALALVEKRIPDVKLVMPGPTRLKDELRSNPLTLKYYELWMQRFIVKNALEKNVVFAGKLSAEEMVEQIRGCNVYVMPSAMEVHAGSLREAMLVGAPSISTYCGSVPEFVKSGENGFMYRYEDYEILAERIMLVLGDDSLAREMAQRGRATSRAMFDDHKDESIYGIYLAIIGEQAS